MCSPDFNTTVSVPEKQNSALLSAFSGILVGAVEGPSRDNEEGAETDTAGNDCWSCAVIAAAYELLCAVEMKTLLTEAGSETVYTTDNPDASSWRRVTVATLRMLTLLPDGAVLRTADINAERNAVESVAPVTV